jgi:hypothetical protein
MEAIIGACDNGQYGPDEAVPLLVWPREQRMRAMRGH